jgi:hypothetical protein
LVFVLDTVKADYAFAGVPLMVAFPIIMGKLTFVHWCGIVASFIACGRVTSAPG